MQLFLLTLPVVWPAAAFAGAPVLLRGGTVMTGSGPVLERADVLLVDGKIAAVGAGLDAPTGAEIVDVSGKVVTPGLVDTHSHLGVFSYPAVPAHADGNEATDPTTPYVRALDSVNPDDPAFADALRGGVTTVQVLPGSANNIGGLSAVLKIKPGRPVSEMQVPGAPAGLKMAMGENPKRVYSERKQLPSSRMGSAYIMRKALQGALDYRAKRKAWDNGDRKDPPPGRDLGAEVLLDAIDGTVRVHVHCYRVDDILTLLRVADEFKLPIASLQHGLEAWRLAPLIAERGIGVATFSDMFGHKEEMARATTRGPAILYAAGVRVAMHTDHPVIEQRWYMHEAAKAVRYGLPREAALLTVTLNPAWILGLDGRIGSLEPGKDADVVIWSGDPLRIESRPERVYVDGELLLGPGAEVAP